MKKCKGFVTVEHEEFDPNKMIIKIILGFGVFILGCGVCMASYYKMEMGMKSI